MSDNIVRQTVRSIRRAVNEMLAETRFGRARTARRELRRIDEWRTNGSPLPPPPELKRSTIKQYQAAHQLHTLVETGTYLGDTIDACRHHFQKIHSIELDQKLAARATDRFQNDAKVKIHQGDSGQILRRILNDIDEPCLFWLDAHYSAGITACGEKETPIEEELGVILDHSHHDHVILIDDARLFLGTHDYPTIERLRRSLLDSRPNWTFELADDIIRFFDNSAQAIRKVA